MIESIYKSKRTIEYLRMGPLGEHVEKLTESLLAKGYLPERLRLNFGVLSGLSHWMGVQSLKMGQLTPERIEEFLEFHKLYRKSGQRRVFIDAVDFFRAEKIIPQARISQVKCIEDLVLFDFEKFLRDHRGVSEGYLKRQVYYGRMFLSEAFAKKRVNFRGLSVTDVTEFIKRHIPDNGSAETRHMVISLRSFFKFLQATNRVKKN